MKFTQSALKNVNLFHSRIISYNDAPFQTPMQRLVRRMTRFFVKTDLEKTRTTLIAAIEKIGFGLKTAGPGQVRMIG